jgi:hypothetical protein
VRHVNGEPSARGSGATSLLRLVHLTDFQLADVASPGRFEFFEELAGRAAAEAFVPAQRAQEVLALHAGGRADKMIAWRRCTFSSLAACSS